MSSEAVVRGNIAEYITYHIKKSLPHYKFNDDDITYLSKKGLANTHYTWNNPTINEPPIKQLMQYTESEVMAIHCCSDGANPVFGITDYKQARECNRPLAQYYDYQSETVQKALAKFFLCSSSEQLEHFSVEELSTHSVNHHEKMLECREHCKKKLQSRIYFRLGSAIAKPVITDMTSKSLFELYLSGVDAPILDYINNTNDYSSDGLYVNSNNSSNDNISTELTAILH